MRLSLLSCAMPLLLFSACAPRTATPNRPTGIPKTASWAEGPSGGAWIDCTRLATDSLRLDCSIFQEGTGVLHARGTFTPNFALGKLPLTYQSYDGGGRITISDTTRLQANGFVDFPSGGGHGTKSGYRSGEPVGPDSTY